MHCKGMTRGYQIICSVRCRERAIAKEQKRNSHMQSVYDSDKILSIDWFKKSLRDDRSALGKRAMIASRAVLFTMSVYAKYKESYRTHFFVTVIKSCVLK